MALPTHPNQIRVSEIQAEFGGSNPIQISEYYAGGTYVDAGTDGFPFGVQTAIPSSGAIKVGDFHGSENGTTYIITWGGGTGTMTGGQQLQFSSSGATTTASATLGGDQNGFTNWLSPYPAGTGTTGLYEVKWVRLSGGTPFYSFGTENVWYALSSNRSIGCPSGSSYDFSIRLASSGGSGSTKQVDFT